MSKRKSLILLPLLLILIVAVAFICFVPFNIPGVYNGQPYRWNGIAQTISQGIDLKGGYYVVLEAKAKDSADDTAQDELLDKAVTILQARLDKKGYTEAVITTQDTASANPKVRVEIPEVDNANEILQIIG